jgi:hypothetical protein
MRHQLIDSKISRSIAPFFSAFWADRSATINIYPTATTNMKNLSALLCVVSMLAGPGSDRAIFWWLLFWVGCLWYLSTADDDEEVDPDAAAPARKPLEEMTAAPEEAAALDVVVNGPPELVVESSTVTGETIVADPRDLCPPDQQTDCHHSHAIPVAPTTATQYERGIVCGDVFEVPRAARNPIPRRQLKVITELEEDQQPEAQSLTEEILVGDRTEREVVDLTSADSPSPAAVSSPNQWLEPSQREYVVDQAVVAPTMVDAEVAGVEEAPAASAAMTEKIRSKIRAKENKRKRMSLAGLFERVTVTRSRARVAPSPTHAENDRARVANSSPVQRLREQLAMTNTPTAHDPFSVVRPVLRTWNSLEPEFPWGSFLASGGFKAVHQVFNARESRMEAVSVL